MSKFLHSSKRRIGFFIALYVVLGCLFYWIVENGWQYAAIQTDAVTISAQTDAGADGLAVEQTFIGQMETIQAVELYIGSLTAQSDSLVDIRILSDQGIVWEKQVTVAALQGHAMNRFTVEPFITDAKSHVYKLTITAPAGVAFGYGATRQAGKFDVQAELTGLLMVNGDAVDGELAMIQAGRDNLNVLPYYFPTMGVVVVLVVLIGIYLKNCKKLGKKTFLLTLIEAMKRYRFLLKQLVMRDFKVKYKASLLGVLWSFLNPLLMTMVYAFVFSTIFKSNIDNFLVYLMTGIVLFNYFSESTSLGLGSIVGNSSLITKVYMPKYVYPLSKVLSSAINLAISFIPLLIMMAATGVAFSKSLFLLPVVVIFLATFCIGISLILSSMMVFFRDTQFLWGILLTMWNFLTPVFYPESIIPSQFIKLYHMNPLYQIIFFMRSITLNGITPTPITYLYCTLSCGITLAFGLYVFRKTQDRFVFYL